MIENQHTVLGAEIETLMTSRGGMGRDIGREHAPPQPTRETGGEL